MYMGKLEQESLRRSKKGEVEKVILKTIAAVGVLSVAVLAPNALKMLGLKKVSEWGRKKEGIKAARKRLVDKGLLAYKNNYLELTKKGEAKLRQLELHDFKYKKSQKWDGKWRILIFDIPEDNRQLRDKIRTTLQLIGFTKLQQSVWVYPFDCEDLITLLKADFRVGRDLLYLIVDSIENDGWLKNHFNLKNE